MGRPSTTHTQIEEIHHLLLENGIPPGTKLPRPLFDKLLMKAYRIGPERSAALAKSGHLLGYWNVESSRGPGRNGTITLQATNPQ